MIPTLDEVRLFLRRLGFEESSLRELIEQIEYFEMEAP